MKQLISWLIRFVPRRYLQALSGTGLRIAGWFLRGTGSTCGICGRSYRRFLPYGRLRARENALCPGCLSLERHRLIWLYLKSKTDFFKRPLDVLHIAPEQCFIGPFTRQHGERYVTADLESPWAKVHMDIHKMPFPDASFDAVLCNHVLEHVADDIQAMREIHRVLKPGGWAILQIPFFRPVPEHTFSDDSVTDVREREKLFGQSDHVRRYGNDYADRILSSGLQPESESFAFSLTEKECREGGIVPEIIFVGRKS